MTAMKRTRNKAGKITAWLVTWEWMGDHAKIKDKITAVLSWRLSPDRIAEIIETIYASEFYTYKERVAFAKDKKLSPYRATPDDIDGIPWQGRMFCGHNPWLEARIVDNLCVIEDSEGNEQLSWEERPKPDISWIRKNPQRDTKHNK